MEDPGKKKGGLQPCTQTLKQALQNFLPFPPKLSCSYPN